mmetsp:Transcript_6506/g.8810  ORF Transcript_6506/g.8810 Transcript_6506/m.8810 type:complete len:153 (-) Transcript_6506:308-766(-)
MEVINVRKKNLVQKGYGDLEHWLTDEDHIYIGRNMTFYVKAAVGSKWANPYSVKKYGRSKCLEMYEKYIRENPKLLNEIKSLKGKVLGCWCSPEVCHGDILMMLVNENDNTIDDANKTKMNEIKAEKPQTMGKRSFTKEIELKKSNKRGRSK